MISKRCLAAMALASLIAVLFFTTTTSILEAQVNENTPPTIHGLEVQPLVATRTQTVTVNFAAKDLEDDLTPGEETGIPLIVTSTLTKPNGETIPIPLIKDEHREGTPYPRMVRFWIGNITIGEADPLGTYMVTVTVEDSGGLTGTETITFEVVNEFSPVPVEIVGIDIPLREVNVGEIISGSITVSVVERVEDVRILFYTGGTLVSNETATLEEGIYTFNVTTKGWEEGTYTISAEATDKDKVKITYQDAETVTLTTPSQEPSSTSIPLELIATAAVIIIAIAIIAYWRRNSGNK